MGKIILKNKLTNEVIELEGEISVAPNGWEIIKEDKRRKSGGPKKKANGDGCFYYSETLGKWIGQYGRKTVTQRKNETKTECKERWEKLKSEIKTGDYIEKNKDTVYTILERDINQRLKDRVTSPRSYQRNCETLQQIKETCKNFVNKPIQQVTAEMIEDAKQNISEYAPNTIDKIWGMLNRCFRIATSRHKIKFNIMLDDTLTKPISIKSTKNIRALTIVEETKLRKILDNEEKNHKYRDIALLQLEVGMRIGETLARTQNDYNKQNGTLDIWNTLTQDENYNIIIGEHTKVYDKKNKIDRGKRLFPLSNKAIKIVNNIINTKITNINNLLFWDYGKNTFISPNEVNSWLNRLDEKYDILDERFDENGNPINLSTHMLRHTKITRLQEAGLPLIVIQYLVGHIEGSKMTNNVYTTISLDFVNNELKKAKIV